MRMGRYWRLWNGRFKDADSGDDLQNYDNSAQYEINHEKMKSENHQKPAPMEDAPDSRNDARKATYRLHMILPRITSALKRTRTVYWKLALHEDKLYESDNE